MDSLSAMFTPEPKQRSNSFRSPSSGFTVKTPATIIPRSFNHTLDGAINSIAICKDGSQIVAAGRTVFKTFKIEGRRFSEQNDLRPGNHTLDSSITDVQWNPNDDSLLASAASNGNIVLWDLSKSSSNKKDHVFSMHSRTVNKIRFHPFEVHLLLSGSHDGSMISFDIRKKTKIAVFSGKSDSIRDVQFSPYDRVKFAAACDNGNVQLWDLRRLDGCVSHFPAHSGPVFALDWHPDDANWLATGGRDKMIKIWDVHHRGPPHHCVLTIAPVACINWRPKERYQIASCSLVFDNYVNIWDIRRPFIPFGVFENHKDVSTGIVWKDPDTLLSCGKDGMIFQHAMLDSIHPANQAPPVGLGLSAQGDVCHSFCDQGFRSKIQRPTPLNQPAQTPTFFKRATPLSDEFKAVTSVLKFHGTPGSETNQFIALASQYKFQDSSFENLCNHNSIVAAGLGLPDIEKTWIVIKHLYTDHGLAAGQSSPDVNLAANQTAINHTHIDKSNSKPRADSTDSNHFGLIDDNESVGENHSRKDSTEKVVNLSLAGPELDMVFGDEQFDSQMFSDDVVADEFQDWALPSEAFQPRHSFIEESHSLDFNDDTDVIGNHDMDLKDSTENINKYSKPAHFPIVEVKLPEFPLWDCTTLVVDMLHRLAELGHIQTTVTAMLVLGDRVDGALDSQIQEEWFLSYIEILQRLQLWLVATRVINASTHPAINSINQNSTTIKTSCGMCNKLLTTSGWYCSECKRLVKPCSVCHLPVRGLYVWCPGCGHGGHLHHLRDWFEREQLCPSGCGHECEYS